MHYCFSLRLAKPWERDKDLGHHKPVHEPSDRDAAVLIDTLCLQPAVQVTESLVIWSLVGPRKAAAASLQRQSLRWFCVKQSTWQKIKPVAQPSDVWALWPKPL